MHGGGGWWREGECTVFVGKKGKKTLLRGEISVDEERKSLDKGEIFGSGKKRKGKRKNTIKGKTAQKEKKRIVNERERI